MNRSWTSRNWQRSSPRTDRWIRAVTAGVAVGLAAVLSSVYPVRVASMRTIFLAALAVNQLIGPVLFRRALSRSGELTPSRSGAEEPLPARG